jgi:catechol 2,3-dioxygenase
VSRVRDLLERERPRPAFDILRAAHAELMVTDLDAAEEFYVERLGLVATARLGGALYLRGWEEHLHHSLVLRQDEKPAVGHIAFRVRDDADLTALGKTFTALGCHCRWEEGERGQGPGLRVLDPFGFPLEFFREMDVVEPLTQAFHLQRGAPVMRFDHVNLHVTHVERTLEYWLDLGFRCSEYISTEGPDERITGAWALRKSTVHDLALTAGRGPRLHHVGLYVAEPMGVIRACDQLAAAGLGDCIERGPGRHGVSNAFYLYLRDPDGHRVEIYTQDYYTGDPDNPKVTWDVHDNQRRDWWGNPVVPSWYTAASLVLDLDGNPQPVVARTDTSEMAATIGADGFSYTRSSEAGDAMPEWKQGEYKLGHQL